MTTQSKFTTFLSVLQHVKSVYQDVTRLSLGHTGIDCHYSHRYNGVGCAIGCCVTSDEAEGLELLQTYISYIMEKDECEAQLRQTFDKSITVAQLSALQKAHDLSPSVAAFKIALDDMINIELSKQK